MYEYTFKYLLQVQEGQSSTGVSAYTQGMSFSTVLTLMGEKFVVFSFNCFFWGGGGG